MEIEELTLCGTKALPVVLRSVWRGCLRCVRCHMPINSFSPTMTLIEESAVRPRVTIKFPQSFQLRNLSIIHRPEVIDKSLCSSVVGREAIREYKLEASHFLRTAFTTLGILNDHTPINASDIAVVARFYQTGISNRH